MNDERMIYIILTNLFYAAARTDDFIQIFTTSTGYSRETLAAIINDSEVVRKKRTTENEMESDN